MNKTGEEKKQVGGWEARLGDVVIAHGPEETLPDAEMRKVHREGGYEIYLHGKLYKR